tara:strand:- start:124 stop:246 length:123 start_codon:yes stop_codon:yes gene_type:complete
MLREFITPEAGEHFVKIAEPGTKMDTRKLILTMFTDLIAY